MVATEPSVATHSCSLEYLSTGGISMTLLRSAARLSNAAANGAYARMILSCSSTAPLSDCQALARQMTTRALLHVRDDHDRRRAKPGKEQPRPRARLTPGDDRVLTERIEDDAARQGAAPDHSGPPL